MSRGAEAISLAKTPDVIPAELLTSAGENATTLQEVWNSVTEEQRDGYWFLLQNMPQRDLESLSADFLREHIEYAYRARAAVPWKVSDELFQNCVLPYANINERRDAWRKDFYEKFMPLVSTAQTPGQAAVILNQKIFPMLQVRYSTQRKKADQSPYETIESGLASCTGLSILLIDACRAVGVPARFVGTPLWSDKSGNHSWVEVWDDGWRFTGAAEPAGDELDKAWFVGRASQSKRDEPKHAIYAVSFNRTPLPFPMVWNRGANYVFAVNVTDRYANRIQDLPNDHVYAMFQVKGPDGQRCCSPLAILDKSGNVVFHGESNDERFDANDHTTVALPVGETFTLKVGEQSKEIKIEPAASSRQLFTVQQD